MLDIGVSRPVWKTNHTHPHYFSYFQGNLKGRKLIDGLAEHTRNRWPSLALESHDQLANESTTHAKYPTDLNSSC